MGETFDKKDKKAKTVLHGFVGIVNKCKRKPGKKFTIALCKNI